MIKIIGFLLRYGVTYSVGFYAGHKAMDWWPLFIALICVATLDAGILYLLKVYKIGDLTHLPYGK